MCDSRESLYWKELCWFGGCGWHWVFAGTKYCVRDVGAVDGCDVREIFYLQKQSAPIDVDDVRIRELRACVVHQVAIVLSSWWYVGCLLIIHCAITLSQKFGGCVEPSREHVGSVFVGVGEEVVTVAKKSLDPSNGNPKLIENGAFVFP